MVSRWPIHYREFSRSALANSLPLELSLVAPSEPLLVSRALLSLATYSD